MIKNDYELLKEIKNGVNVEENNYFLYEKYTPMINKHASYLFSKFKNYNSELKNDYKQDAYFSMLDAIKSTNLDLVTYNQDEWLFVGRFWFYLKGLSKKYFKKIIKNPMDIDLLEGTNYVGYFQGYQDCYLEIYEKILSKINTMVYMEIGLKPKYKFVNFNNDHIEVLNYRLQGFHIDEIKNIMNKSYGWVHLKLYELSCLIKNEFGIEYSF